MFSKQFFKNILQIFFGLIWLIPISVTAVEVHRVAGIPIKNDISLTPAKVELSLNAGDVATKILNVQNRTGRNMIFKVEVEDFSPSDDSQGVILNKTIQGLNSSLKRYISVEENSFMVAQGEEARIPVRIKLPEAINSTGLYAAVLISATSADEEQGATKVVTRLGALFFVKVKGVLAHPIGMLKDVSFKDNKFEIVFENSGDIHLVPYGQIEIVDSSNNIVDKMNLDAWFVLPKSVRSRFAAIETLDSGRYTANFSVNRGYNNVVDTKSLNFEINNPVYETKTILLISLVSVISLILLYKFVL